MKKVITLLALLMVVQSFFVLPGCIDFSDGAKYHKKLINYFSGYESKDKIALQYFNDFCVYQNGKMNNIHGNSKYEILEFHQTYLVVKKDKKIYKTDYNYENFETIEYAPMPENNSYIVSYGKEMMCSGGYNYLTITHKESGVTKKIKDKNVFANKMFGSFLSKVNMFLYTFCLYEDEIYFGMTNYDSVVVLKYDWSSEEFEFYSLLYGIHYSENATLEYIYTD